MQHDNNIEDKLRQLEAMEQPDVSQMDNHWQQMQAMLQPGSLPMKKGWPKWMLNGFYGATIVVLIGAVAWYISSRKSDVKESIVLHNEKTPEETTRTNSIQTTPEIVITDIAIKPTRTAVLHQPKINPSLIDDIVGNADSTKRTSQDSILGTIKLRVTDCISCPGKKDVHAAGISENHMRLQNLFAQLENGEQYFIVDNSRDTLLRFKEGTRLLIPANSFNGMNGVELTAKEFYKTSDIILNQLNTESDKGQLETGGMLYLQANYKGKEVSINKNNPVALFMADTSSRIGDMQLFYKRNAVQANADLKAEVGDTSSGNNINWVAQPFRFNRFNTAVRVLNLVNMPYDIKVKGEKRIAYFLVDEDLQVSKDLLKKLLKEKYGYDKIKLRNAEWWEIHNRNISWSETGSGYFNSFYATKIGDSLWMEKDVAEKYKLVGTATKAVSSNNNISLNYQGYQPSATSFQQVFDKLSFQTAQDLKDKYGVSLNQLGWINCDRFYADSRKKINYEVDLGDSAVNYYTMLVFDNIRSMMTGYASGNQVAFQNVPIGEPVKIISIGINKKGETVYSVTHTTTSEEVLKGLQFQTTSAPELRTSLSKLDK